MDGPGIEAAASRGAAPGPFSLRSTRVNLASFPPLEGP